MSTRSARRGPRLPGTHGVRTRKSTPAPASKPLSELALPSAAPEQPKLPLEFNDDTDELMRSELVVDTDSGDAKQRRLASDRSLVEFFAHAVVRQPSQLENYVVYPNDFKLLLTGLAPITSESWDNILRALGSDEQRLLRAFVRRYWDKLVADAGPDARRVLWEIMERMLSTFARCKSASTARDAYEARHGDARLDSSLAIKLAAGAAVARVLDGDDKVPMSRLPDWAVWPLLEIDYENRPARLAETFLVVEQMLLSPTAPVDWAFRAATQQLGRPHASVSSYLDAIRPLLVRCVPSDSGITDDITEALTPASSRAAGGQKDWVSRMFYFGLRFSFEHAGREEPTAPDLAELALCWDIESGERARPPRRVWEDRIR